jgi:hypothetical protein
VKPEQAPKGWMRASSPRNADEDRRGGSEQPTKTDLPALRGIGHSTYAHIHGQHGRPAGAPRGNGVIGLRRRQESEEVIVAMKSGNADGAKDLWFEVRLDETRGWRLA